MLGELGGDLEVVGEAENGWQALAQVEQLKPDLLLLDIRMPGMDGLELAARYAQLPPVVFVTAHDEHAVQAFELNAVDYLLKPIRAERLVQALARARQRCKSAAESFGVLPVPPEASGPPRVITHDRGTARFFDARAVTRFRAFEKYTSFQVDGQEQLTAEPLSQLETRLAGWGFRRVHRAELIRLSAVRAVRVVEGMTEVELEDGQVAQVSRRLVAQLRRELGL
jgi:DNA-binding LytR/AlgR family response regulator